MRRFRPALMALLAVSIAAPFCPAGQDGQEKRHPLTPPPVPDYSKQRRNDPLNPLNKKLANVKTFTPAWKEFNAAVKSNSAPVIIFFVEAGTQKTFTHPVPDVGGARAFTYVMVALTSDDLKKARDLEKYWEEGNDLFTRWEKPNKSPAEIAALYGVDRVPTAVICDKNFNELAEADAIEILADLPNLKDDIEAASKQLEEIFNKEIERVKKSFEAEQDREKYTSGTIRRLLHLAHYRHFGRDARSMLQDIDEHGEEELDKAVEEKVRAKISDVASRYRGLPVSLKAREASKEAAEEEKEEKAKQ